jgi:penicillin-insensitive murein endopeptidase
VLVALAALFAGAFPPAAEAKRTVLVARVPTLPRALRKSRSLGFPWRGSLQRGVKLEPSKTLRYVTEYAPTNHFYGTWELVQLLQRAAHRVAVRLPGARLSVGELSAQHGGNLPGHASHESGRDVDIGFYMRDAAGRPYEAFAFANFDARGRGLPPNEGLSFDVARNWELVGKLVADGDARVQYIFVAPGIRNLLLSHARSVGSPKVVVDRASRVMVRPNEKHPHGNHFHVRIYCSPFDRPKCKDRAPFWPWSPGSPL